MIFDDKHELYSHALRSTVRPFMRAIVIIVLAIMATMALVCAICGSSDEIIPCLLCDLPRCETCMNEDIACKGCQMGEQLEWDSEQSEQSKKSEESKQSEETKQVSRIELYSPQVDVSHYIETGMLPFHGILYPTLEQWDSVKAILLTYIQFTTSSQGIKSPMEGRKYLVGHVPHRFPNRVWAHTDYIMMYDKKEWKRFIVTYYDQSPMRHDKNVFYPLPLPLQFD